MEYNVFISNFNSRDKIEKFNIFNSIKFSEGIKTLKKKQKKYTFEEFKKELRSLLMYVFWSKCEYEIELKGLFDKRTEGTKVDVYTQVMLNFDLLAKYIWEE